jgi:hypothetical protein
VAIEVDLFWGAGDVLVFAHVPGPAGAILGAKCHHLKHVVTALGAFSLYAKPFVAVI